MRFLVAKKAPIKAGLAAQNAEGIYISIMAGLVPAIYVFGPAFKTWMPGTTAGHDGSEFVVKNTAGKRLTRYCCVVG